MKQSHVNNDKHFIKKIKQAVKKFETKTPYHFNNRPNLLIMNNSYSNLLVLPLEVYLSENMSINLRGEMIPMACSCFLEKSRNIQQVNLVYSIQRLRSMQLFKNRKSRRKRKIEDENRNNSDREKNIMKLLCENNDEHLIKKRK
jgi:hypothetical protein